MEHGNIDSTYDELLKKIERDHQCVVKEIQTEHRQNVRRTWAFFAILLAVIAILIGVALFFIDGSFIAELRAGNGSITKNTDFLELILPIVGVTVIAIVAFLGMNRLKDMDAQMDRMQSNIDSALGKEIQRISTLRRDLSMHIDDAIGTKTKDFATQMTDQMQQQAKSGKQQILKSQETALQKLQDQTQTFDQRAKESQKKCDDFDKKYNWLLADSAAGKTLLNEVASVSDVHRAVETLWNREEKPQNIRSLTRRYVEKVTAKDSDLRGDAADYHNLDAECGRRSLHDLGCAVCRKGLEYFPQNMDLLADWIQDACSIGDLDGAEKEPLGRLMAIEKKFWNWRAFDFTIGFYLTRQRFEEAEQLAKEFIKCMPYEERGYYALADAYAQQHTEDKNAEQAIKILQNALDQGINCPMCANKLSELLSDYGRLEEALQASDRAIGELSQDQPSVIYAYPLYRRALIQDRMAFRALAKGEDGKDMAQKAALDYQVAIRSNQLPPTPETQARVRLNLLETYFKIEVSKDDEMDIESLSKLLAMLPDTSEDEGET